MARQLDVSTLDDILSELTEKTEPADAQHVIPGVLPDGIKVYEDTSFVAGDSPVTLDINADLTRNGVDGYIANDGLGDFTVEIDHTGAGSWEDSATLKKGDTLDLEHLNVDSIRLTHGGTDSSYRVFVV